MILRRYIPIKILEHSPTVSRKHMRFAWFYKYSVRILTVVLTTVAAIASGCGKTAGSFYYGAMGFGEKKLLVATLNPGALTVVMYDLEGKFIDLIADYTQTNENPRGIAPYDVLNIAVLIDGVDRLSKASLIGGSVTDISTDAGLTGNLYQLAYDAVGSRYFAIETSTIEGFQKDGTRIGNPYISATTGSCVISVARGITASNSRLYVTSTTNDDLNVYDISGATPTCLTANTTFGNVDPIGVMVHSNGLVYVGTQGDDRIYSFPNDGSGAGTVVWDTNTSIISNPTDLVEMPDGTILVASDATNSIERINVDGTSVSSTSFIKDAFTGLISQMLIVGGE